MRIKTFIWGSRWRALFGMVGISMAEFIGLAPAAAVAQTPPPIAIPESQQAFVDLIAQYREAYRSAPNAMAKAATRPARGEALCRLMPGLTVRDWVGTVSEIGANEQGNGTLQISVAGNVRFKTWFVARVDAPYGTLIPPTSALSGQVSALRTRQPVIFSGEVFRNERDCWREASADIIGTMIGPDFIMRFTEVRPVQ